MATSTGAADVFPRPTHDEAARQRYAMGLRQYLFGPFRQAVGEAFYKEVAPAYERREGEPLKDRRRAREEILSLPSYQYFSDLHLISQEMIWNSVLDTLERTEDDLRARFRALGEGEGTRGSLELDPGFEIPRYLTAIDIHHMPGSYQRSTGDDDVIAGALYDQGGFLYAPGGGPRRDGMGRTSLAVLRELFPELKPRRILDMGCGIGGPTLAYVEAFPEAEVHAIDVGPAMLRYGHMRAEALGMPIHFSQQNAERTRFEDGSFDLVVSHIMFHETSAKAIQPILDESFRLLAPGGVMLHLDLPPPEALPDIFTQVIFDGDAHYNNEPFWMRMHERDWPACIAQAGFDPERIVMRPAPVQMFVPPGPGNPEGGWRATPLMLFAMAASVPA